MFQPPPHPPYPPAAPFPPTPPYYYYPPASVRLGYWALRRLVKQFPPQTYAEWQYQQALRTELRVRKWALIVSLIPR